MKTKLLVSAFSFLFLSGFAQVTWVNYVNNPIIIPSTFDSHAKSTYGYQVRYDGSLYRLWYTRKVGATEKENIAYATSADGLNWTLVDSLSFVASTVAGRFDGKNVGQGSIIKDVGDTLKMWYWGTKSGQFIGLAWSMDGQHWNRVDGSGTGKSVFDVTMDGSSALGLVTPSVVKDGGIYHMWYSRFALNGSLPILRIGYATSTNGRNWTNVVGSGTNGAVLDLSVGSFDANALYFPSVIKNNGLFEMWYGGSDDNALVSGWRIGYATSLDGKNWTKVKGLKAKGSVIDSSNCPSVMVTGGNYRMWYSSDKGVNYATSVFVNINEVANDALSIYPNPSTGIFRINSNTTKPSTIVVYNFIGEQIIQVSNAIEINLSNYPKGIYYLKSDDGSGSNTSKIILQ